MEPLFLTHKNIYLFEFVKNILNLSTALQEILEVLDIHPKNNYALDAHACDTIFAVKKSH